MESPLKRADVSIMKSMAILFKKRVRAYQTRRQKKQTALLSAVTRAYEVKMMKIPPEILNKPISMLTKEDFAYLGDKENSKSAISSSSSLATEGKSDFMERRVTRSKLSKLTTTCGRGDKCKEDFAYLGDKENSKSAISSSSSLATEGKSDFKERRVTRSKLTTTCGRGDKFKTPANQKPPLSAGMVTPKFNPYAPMSVLRMPKEGEIAMSMSGSPLHVTNIINESKPNVVVPLQGGRILSVMPERGLRRSEIPEIDGDLRRQLKVLNDNITAILGLD